MPNASSGSISSSEQPAPTPTYIFRGHASAIHALFFSKSNLQLFSGDADGWVVLWLLTTKRPIAVWRAHDGAILGARTWTNGRIITHGRDGRLRVWGLGDVDSAEYSTELPLEDTSRHRKAPWMYHSLEVSSLTFCSFDACLKLQKGGHTANGAGGESARNETSDTQDKAMPDDMLVAVPGTRDSSIDIIELPRERTVAMIPAPDQTNGKAGMVMAIKIIYTPDGRLIVIAGYESGRTNVFRQVIEAGQWESIYTSRPHSQPILSLDITPDQDSFITSAADAIVAKHRLDWAAAESKPPKESQTRHSGQQGLSIRDDGRIFATAGWDGRGRVYSVKTLKELAVLKWHKEGCYALAFASVRAADEDTTNSSTVNPTNTLIKAAYAFNSVGLVRTRTAQLTHWLALGSKDGKISLWDIY